MTIVFLFHLVYFIDADKCTKVILQALLSPINIPIVLIILIDMFFLISGRIPTGIYQGTSFVFCEMKYP